MFDLGTQELLLIFIVAFLVFGPKKLPELGRTLGKGMRELKTAMRGIKDSFDEAEADVSDELKQTKKDLEETVYSSIEPHITNNDKDETKNPSETDETSVIKEKEEPAASVEKETEKDG